MLKPIDKVADSTRTSKDRRGVTTGRHSNRGRGSRQSVEYVITWTGKFRSTGSLPDDEPWAGEIPSVLSTRLSVSTSLDRCQFFFMKFNCSQSVPMQTRLRNGIRIHRQAGLVGVRTCRRKKERAEPVRSALLKTSAPTGIGSWSAWGVGPAGLEPATSGL